MIASLTGETLASAKISFCGPASLRNALKKDFQRHGVSARDFHYEEFEFRTGIGLKSLAAWVLERTYRFKPK